MEALLVILGVAPGGFGGNLKDIGDHNEFQSACHTGPRILATDFHGPTVLTSLHQLILHSFFADSSLFRNYDGSPSTRKNNKKLAHPSYRQMLRNCILDIL